MLYSINCPPHSTTITYLMHNLIRYNSTRFWSILALYECQPYLRMFTLSFRCVRAGLGCRISGWLLTIAPSTKAVHNECAYCFVCSSIVLDMIQKHCRRLCLIKQINCVNLFATRRLMAQNGDAYSHIQKPTHQRIPYLMHIRQLTYPPTGRRFT